MQRTKEEVLELCDELAEQSAAIVKEHVRRLLMSGAVEVDEHAEQKYWLPKALVSAACLHASRQWENPLDDEWMETAENLSHF